MAKNCKADNCGYIVFGKGYCKSHQYLRLDYNPYVYKKEPTGELEIFKDIWNKRPHVSFLSNKKLNEFSVSLFAHVLPKGQNKFPKWKLKPNNIILLTAEEHDLLDKGTKAQREKYAQQNNCDWNKIYKLYNQLENDYKKEFGI